MKPGLQKMAGEFQGKVKFVAVDVDESEAVAQKYKVEYMPTLVILKGGQEVGRVVGADEAEIKSMITGAL